MGIQLSTRLVPIPGIPFKLGQSPLGLLAPLAGKWVGSGFNQIFRPLNGSGSDNFLELNLTNETLEFNEIPGEIPNRGFAQADVSLFGLTYLQQVSDANVKDGNGNPAGIHIEPGIWINIPATTEPSEQATVARLANIPHGTSLVAQGTASVVSGPPVFPAVDITPFFIGNPANKVPFADRTTLANPSPFRSPPADIVGVTQTMVDDPNSVLRAALVGKTIHSTTVIQITTASKPGAVPDAGGGVSDIAFLDGTGNPNARVDSMTATFWISDFTDASGPGTLLQYSQTVLLNFAPLSWPHVSVANLLKQHTKPIKEGKEKVEIKEVKDHKPEIKEHKFEVKELEGPVHPFPPLPPDPTQPLGQDPGRAGPAAAAGSMHFIAADERPVVAGPPAADVAADEPTAPGGGAPAAEHEEPPEVP